MSRNFFKPAAIAASAVAAKAATITPRPIIFLTSQSGFCGATHLTQTLPHLQKAGFTRFILPTISKEKAKLYSDEKYNYNRFISYVEPIFAICDYVKKNHGLHYDNITPKNFSRIIALVSDVEILNIVNSLKLKLTDEQLIRTFLQLREMEYVDSPLPECLQEAEKTFGKKNIAIGEEAISPAVKSFMESEVGYNLGSAAEMQILQNISRPGSIGLVPHTLEVKKLLGQQEILVNTVLNCAGSQDMNLRDAAKTVAKTFTSFPFWVVIKDREHNSSNESEMQAVKQSFGTNMREYIKEIDIMGMPQPHFFDELRTSLGIGADKSR